MHVFSKRLVPFLLFMIAFQPLFPGSFVQGAFDRPVAQVQTPAGTLISLNNQSSPTAPADPTAPTDIPVRLVDSGVNTFSTTGQVFYYITQPANCNGGPRPTTISRVRTTGWETLVVFSYLPVSGETCPYRIASNVVADAQYLYFIAPPGLVRFPLNTAPTSPAELLLPEFTQTTYGELAIDATRLFGIADGSLWYANKADIPNQKVPLAYVGPDPARSLQWDGTSVYIIWGNTKLLDRFGLNGSRNSIASNVVSYTPVGYETFCSIQGCTQHQYVYYVQSTAENKIVRWDRDHTNLVVYTSTPPAGQAARIYALASAYSSTFLNSNLTKDVFFFEKQWVPCSCIITNSRDWLVRLDGGGAPGSFLYFRDADTSWQARNLITGDNFVFWKDGIINVDDFGAAYRIPVNAAGLPSINLRVTGYQIIQSIQNEDNSMFLVHYKPTYVRVYTKSDGVDVYNVTARLTAYWNNSPQDSISPVKPLMTVNQYPAPTKLDKNFLFALPTEWTAHADLRIEVNLNPYGFPLEPNYNDNIASYGPFTWVANPHVNFRIMRVGYTWAGKDYNTTLDDYSSIVSWLYRAYPLGTEPGQVQALVESYRNNALGSKVLDFNNEKECQYLLVMDGNVVKSDNRNLCASYTMHTIILNLRNQGLLSNNSYFYASIPGLARGSASGQGPSSNGPSYLALGWSFAQSGFYGGHELGHLFGRGHPKPMAAACGHSADDALFPYLFAWIGDNTAGHQNSVLDTQQGVDAGSPVLYQWFNNISDVMSYCTIPTQWPSDYTYQALYNWAIAHPTPLAAAPDAASPRQPLLGDFLNVAGLVTTDGSLAHINSLQRVDSMVALPAPIPGPYSLRLLNTSGGILADHSFAPDPTDESPDWASFNFVVPFVAGTASVEVVNTASGIVLFSQVVSANPPVISNVVVNAPEPISGIVPLSWTASDPEGDPLSFDIFYSVDGGFTFNILQTHSGSNSLDLDTSSLPGGMLIFRVRASDGVNTATAESAPVQSEVKPPMVKILPPGGLDSVEPGQVLNLAGSALDPQDGGMVGDFSLVWTVNAPGQAPSVFAYGTSVSLSVSSAGPMAVTLTATNSSGLSASDTLTINSADNLNNPLPTLSVFPAVVTFQSNPGDLAPQTSQVQIENAGGPGNINWSASIESAVPGWLTSSDLSGAAPFTITLTAAPANVPANVTLSATLVVTGSSTAGIETIRIPVTWQSGGGLIVNPGSGNVNKIVYLPLISRR